MRKICLHCNNPFDTIRDTAKYCGPAHRSAALRARRGDFHRKPKHTICQREGCENEISLTAKATTIYCSNACRQKVWHNDPENKKKAKEKLKIKNAKIAASKKDKQARKTVDAMSLEEIQELME